MTKGGRSRSTRSPAAQVTTSAPSTPLRVQLLMVAAAYFKHKGEHDRKRVLVPDSAHGTNPASAVLAGFEAVTVKTREVLNAHRATLYLVDPDRGMLRSKIAEQEGAEALEIRVPVGKGIAGRVAKTGEILNIEDAWSHPDSNREVDERTGYRTRSLLCMPVYNRKGEVFAVAQLLNRRDGLPFSRGDTERFAEFAKPLGVILEGCCLVAARSRPV